MWQDKDNILTIPFVDNKVMQTCNMRPCVRTSYCALCFLLMCGDFKSVCLSIAIGSKILQEMQILPKII